MPREKKYTAEQILTKLREVEVLLAKELKSLQVCKKLILACGSLKSPLGGRNLVAKHPAGSREYWR